MRDGTFNGVVMLWFLDFINYFLHLVMVQIVYFCKLLNIFNARVLLLDPCTFDIS